MPVRSYIQKDYGPMSVGTIGHAQAIWYIQLSNGPQIMQRGNTYLRSYVSAYLLLNACPLAYVS